MNRHPAQAPHVCNFVHEAAICEQPFPNHAAWLAHVHAAHAPSIPPEPECDEDCNALGAPGSVLARCPVCDHSYHFTSRSQYLNTRKRWRAAIVAQVKRALAQLV